MRTFVRTRSFDLSVLLDAVEATMQVDVPRGPDKYSTSVHVMGTDGRRAFSMSRDVYDEAGVATVLGVPLHRVSGSQDPVTIEA